MNFKDYVSSCVSSVPIEDAIERYTGRPIRNHRTSCPIHNGNGQNFRTDGDMYYCYVCHSHGNVVQFVQEYFGLTAWEAIRKIDGDYGLGLPFGTDYDPKAAKIMREARRRREKEAKTRQEQQDYLYTLTAIYEAWCLLRTDAKEAMLKYRPTDPGEDIHPQYASACMWWDYICWNMDELELEMSEVKRKWKERERKSSGTSKNAMVS